MTPMYDRFWWPAPVTEHQTTGYFTGQPVYFMQSGNAGSYAAVAFPMQPLRARISSRADAALVRAGVRAVDDARGVMRDAARADALA